MVRLSDGATAVSRANFDPWMIIFQGPRSSSQLRWTKRWQLGGFCGIWSVSFGSCIGMSVLSPSCALQDADPSQPYYVEVQKIAAPGGPIFSIAPLRTLPTSGVLPGVVMPSTSGSGSTGNSSSGGASLPAIFCGNAAKEVISWQPFMPSFTNVSMP